MKTHIPQDLKEDMPHTWWGKTLSATPVILTVIATMLAGLSSSEMTRAQYDRSLAAQQQSKAGDQWNFFQGKKLRGITQRSTLDMITSSQAVRPIDEARLRSALSSAASTVSLDSPEIRTAVGHLIAGTLPEAAATPPSPPEISIAAHALEGPSPDDELPALLAHVENAKLEAALNAARARAQALDSVTGPVTKSIEAIEKSLAPMTTPGVEEIRRDFVAARLAFTGRRYDAEAGLNQAIAYLYELQVRKSNLAAERYHRRSQRFFYGMLAAQMGVILSTLAMAARKRNLLWSIAAVAGVIAITFAVYVYLYV